MSEINDYSELIERYTAEIEEAINDFCFKYDIENLAAETQNRWNACLSFIHKRVFKGENLKSANNNCNSYNYDLLYEILNIYIEFCNLYTKEVSINGYSKLLDIDYEVILYWKNNNNVNRLSDKGFRIYKKLMQENEQSNSDLLTSARNPVGVMARLNHVHNWSAQQIQQEQLARALPASDLTRLDLSKKPEKLELVKVIDNIPNDINDS